MRFCTECNSVCYNDYKKNQAVCSKCGYTLEAEQPKPIINNRLIDEKLSVIKDSVKRSLGGSRVDTLCVKCGYKQAYVTIVAARNESDYEAERYTCAMCGHSWRET